MARPRCDTPFVLVLRYCFLMQSSCSLACWWICIGFVQLCNELCSSRLEEMVLSSNNSRHKDYSCHVKWLEVYVDLAQPSHPSGCWLAMCSCKDCNGCFWRAPKFLVRPKKGSTMLKNRSSWNLVPLPASSTRRGQEGRAESFDIRLGRGTSYLVTRSCIQNQPTSGLVHIRNTLGVGTSHGQPWTHLTHHGPDSGEATIFPHIVLSLCASSPHLHPNAIFSCDSQSGVPKP
jgi:hypothetical protein